MSTAATLATLSRGWTTGVLLHNHGRVGPGIVALPNHWRREPDNKIVRLAGQVVLDPCLTGWHPVLGVRRLPAYFINFVKMVQVLYISGVMPSKIS